jgi:hypothetical protein
MGQFANELIESLQQAAKHAAGRRMRGLRVSELELPADSSAEQPVKATAEAKSRNDTD